MAYRDYLIRAFNQDVPMIYTKNIWQAICWKILVLIWLAELMSQSLNRSRYMGEGKHSPVSIKQEEAD
ncbi:MAG: hypothetical protein R3B93_07395 [Bacteroidia bacterium]